ncbi:TerB family tellurite resistance protein [Novispirillum sp. DQ9]|uniref:tellurite resistance TerB family protein n=1 Tax=Novispirillum sp. DQ9 TaxID=3398612 RepID=UPI003C7E42D2
MLSKLKSFLFADGGSGATPASDDEAARLACAVLLAEAGLMDGSLDGAEHDSIVHLLGKRFALDAAQAAALLDAALAEARRSTELYGHARRVKDHFSYDDRVELMEMLWEVVYADGALHDYESNLMRRLAGLLYVEDVDSGAARKRAMDRLGLS